MHFVILFSSSWQSDCVSFGRFKQQSLDVPKTEIRSDFKRVFTVILKKCQLRFSHNYKVLPLLKYPRWQNRY